jgi:small subunit ribosomal protein S1
VVKITNAGAFIELEEGIDGFLHSDDISWTKKIKHPGSELEVGREVEIMVIGLDRESRNIKLGIKQLSEDPWRNFSESYRPGTLVEGEVSSVTDFGVFVKVPGGIEGLIHKSNLPENREEDPDEALKKYHPGDKIKAVVLEIQPDKQKVAFSIRDYQKKVQRDEMSRYMAAGESDGSTFTLGDFLKSKGGAEKTSPSPDLRPAPEEKTSAPDDPAPADVPAAETAAPAETDAPEPADTPAETENPADAAAETDKPVEAADADTQTDAG